MLNREELVKILREEFDSLRTDFGVKRIAIFGSFADNTQTVDSDVDVLIELVEPLGFKFFDLVDCLERIVGRKMDILTADALKTMRVKQVARSIEKNLFYV
jgi:predicted nucleotidyltransferase